MKIISETRIFPSLNDSSVHNITDYKSSGSDSFSGVIYMRRKQEVWVRLMKFDF